MTVKPWGYERVSTALEVYDVLTSPPRDSGHHSFWLQLLEFEPPFWGSLLDHAPAVAELIAHGYRVWSWDDHGAVLSPSHAEPPQGVRYRTWSYLLQEHDDSPTQPIALPSRALRTGTR